VVGIMLIISRFHMRWINITKILLLNLIIIILPLFEIIAYGHHPHDPVAALTVSPEYHEDKTVFLAIGAKLKKSMNGGTSWEKLVRGIETNKPYTFLAISPFYGEDKTIFLGTSEGYIYKSTDEGLSWVLASRPRVKGGVSEIGISPNYSQDKNILAAGKEGGFIISQNGGRSWDDIAIPASIIESMAFLPDRQGKIVIVGGNDGRLYLSEDNCRTWQVIFDLPESEGITAVAVSSDSPIERTVYIGTKKGGIFKTDPGGLEFYRENAGLPREEVKSIVISPTYSKNGIVFASSWYKAVFKRNPESETWALSSTGLTTSDQADSHEYKSPYFTEISISRNFDKDKTLFLSGFDGLFKSIDEGETWTELETLSVGLIKGMATATNRDENPEIAFITYGAGAYFSHDQGNTWSINNIGLNTTRLMDIAYSPSYKSDSTVFSASSGRLLKSVNGGRTWNQIILKEDLSFWDGVNNFLQRIIKRFEKTVGSPGFLSDRFLEKPKERRPYPTRITLSPSYAKDGTIFFGTRWHGVYKSTDGGNTCYSSGLELGRVMSISVSPSYVKDQTVFANSLGRGVYKTEDGGKSWRAVNSGLPRAYAQEQPDDIVSPWKEIKLLLSPDYGKDKIVFSGSPEGLFKSNDGGENWVRVGPDSPVYRGVVIGMGISPCFGDDGKIIVSVKGKGLFQSDDGGITFEEIAPQLIHNNHALKFIEFSPKYCEDDTLYGASEEHMFISKDGGDTWKVIKRPLRYENHRDVVKYAGEWAVQRGKDRSAGSACFSNSAGDTVQLTFVGESIKWIGSTGPDHGVAKVYIDDRYTKEVDLYRDAGSSMDEVFSVSDLRYGPHRVRVEISPSKNVRSSGNRVEVDAFDVF
jgi:photosystem II stability/assembly factor-like uncharacterized protein